jgi:hypothetical protein
VLVEQCGPPLARDQSVDARTVHERDPAKIKKECLGVDESPQNLFPQLRRRCYIEFTGDHQGLATCADLDRKGQ